MSEYLFKATNRNRANHGGNYLYRKGQWTRTETPILCESGWHLAKGKQVLRWLAPTLWLAEIHPDADVVEGPDKIVASKIRVVERLDGWNDRTARLFACDCADDVLALIENPDSRSVEVVAVARRFANGDATRAELDAARAAAWAAAGNATWDAAKSAAWDAARDAARAATWATAGAAASDAQYRRLLGYLGLQVTDNE